MHPLRYSHLNHSLTHSITLSLNHFQQPTSRPTKRPVFVRQTILGVTANTPEFQTAFTASIMSVLPTGSTVTITSVQLFWSDGTVTTSTSRRRELAQATVVGVQVAYSVVTAASAGSTSSIEALLSNPATVSAVSTNLATTIPGATVQAPLMLDPSSAPTPAPTFAPSSLQPTKQTVLAPTVEMGVTPSPSQFPTVTSGSFNTVVSVSQIVTSATLTVSQAQSSSFMTAFAAGIQNAVPGVTITVTSVSAARRRLLASVVVSYTAGSATASASALAASLSSPAAIAATSASLGAAGYAGVFVSSPVFASAGGSGSTVAAASASSATAGGGSNVGVIVGATVGVLVPVLIGLALLIVYLVKPQLLGCNKTQGATRAVNNRIPVRTMTPHATKSAAGVRGSNGLATIPSLPPEPDFVAYCDHSSGLTYYVDGTTGATVWARPGELLPGWTAELDRSSNRLFYHHQDTRTVSWERPSNDYDIAPPAPPVDVGQVEIDLSTNENDGGRLLENTRADSQPLSTSRPSPPPMPSLSASRSPSHVHLEIIHTAQDEVPPFFANNDMYHAGFMNQDHTASSTAMVGSNVLFVLPRSRRPSVELGVRSGDETGQGQGQGQGQVNGQSNIGNLSPFSPTDAPVTPWSLVRKTPASGRAAATFSPRVYENVSSSASYIDGKPPLPPLPPLPP